MSYVLTIAIVHNIIDMRAVILMIEYIQASYTQVNSLISVTNQAWDWLN
jgi:hypothetical protein